MLAPGLSMVWPDVAIVSHLVGASAAVTVAAALWPRRRRFGLAGPAIIASLAGIALWCLAVAAEGGQGLVGTGALAMRNLAFLVAVYRLFSGDGRHASVPPVRPVVVALVMVNLLMPLVRLFEVEGGGQIYLLLAMLEVVGSLVLVHNLYAGASGEARAVLRWPTLGFAAVWCFELNLYTVAYLGESWPGQLAALHGIVDAGFAALMAFGAMHGREGLRLRPSRKVAFRSFSLLVIGGYLAAMVVVARWLAAAGGDYARWLQFGFLIAASAAAALILPSRRLRGWLRVMLVKHLFQHRYDYRAEWLRFTQTIGCISEDALPLQQRAIRALADITDSPRGLLLVPDPSGDLVLAARWQWSTIEVPPLALPMAAAHAFEREDFIVQLDDLRPGGMARGRIAPLPAWLLDETSAWAVVPLLHYDRMMGGVVLARPPHDRRLDWEDFDLLRVVGQQLATWLAEHDSQQALIEAGRFEDFHRRIAFVMHDIKNLASQFGLLARNAERHAENPAFRADMLVTLRNSADKLNALVARLSRYGGGSVDTTQVVSLGAAARQVAGQFGNRHPVRVIERNECRVTGNAHSIEQVLLHLVQNGVDASPSGEAVFLNIGGDGSFGRIEVVDAGHGMSGEFIHSRLFRPFDSSKPGGFGIGAYEARELVRAMGGRLEVESREGVGTRFIVRLPLAGTSEVLRNIGNTGERVA